MQAIEPKFTGRVWPTGKFGVSRVRETPFLSLCQSHHETHETQWKSSLVKVHGAIAVLRFLGKLEMVLNPDLSNVSKSPIRSRRGHKGIPRYGRNLISSAAVVMERKFDRKLLTFGTVTLPSAPDEHLLQIARNWSAVVKQFVKNLRRGLQSKALPSQVFGVTEIQEKRLERFGIPALHLHFVFVGRSSRKASWQVNRKNIRRWWKSAIAKYLPADTDYRSVENVGAIKKSAASYLGKYMSKGSAAIAKVIEKGFADWIPSAWYTISHELRREVLSAVRSGEQVGNFLNWICSNRVQNLLSWFQPVAIERSPGFIYQVGFCGTLSQQGLDSLLLI